MTTRIEFQLLEGSRAVVGRSGVHCVIADRPSGKSGGMGLGFNGGEFLAFAIGGCFCNDLQAIADLIGVKIARLNVTVSIDFEGDPVRAERSKMMVHCMLEDGSDPTLLIERAKRATTISNSLRQGIPVEIAAD